MFYIRFTAGYATKKFILILLGFLLYGVDTRTNSYYLSRCFSLTTVMSWRSTEAKIKEL